jgi:integrase
MMMIKLSLETGLRISEVLALRWEELELEQGAIKQKRTTLCFPHRWGTSVYQPG